MTVARFTFVLPVEPEPEPETEAEAGPDRSAGVIRVRWIGDIGLMRGAE